MAKSKTSYKLTNGRTSLTGFGEAAETLKRIEVNMRRLHVRKGITAAAKVVQKAAKKKAPSSQETGTREKWSDREKADRSKHNINLRDGIKYVVREGNRAFYAVVGPIKQVFWAKWVEFGFPLVLWGQPTSRRVPPQPFMRPAVEGTKAEQRSAFETAVKKSAERQLARESKKT